MKKLLRNPFLNTSFFKFKKKGSESGFSLMEIIIVIAIIGTLVGVIISRISGGADNAKVGITDTKAQVMTKTSRQVEVVSVEAVSLTLSQSAEEQKSEKGVSIEV